MKVFRLLALTTAVAATLSTSASAAPSENAVGRMFGAGSAFGVDDLPPGILRSSLESLPEQARAKAVNWLSTFTFPEEDVQTLRVDPEGGIYYEDTETPQAITGDAGASTLPPRPSACTAAPVPAV